MTQFNQNVRNCLKLSRVGPYSFYTEDNCKLVHKLELFLASSLSSSSVFSRMLSFSFAAFLSALDLESSTSLAFSLASFARESASSCKALRSLARRFFLFLQLSFFLKNYFSLAVLRSLLLLFLLLFKIGRVTFSPCSSCCKKFPANHQLTKPSNALNVVMNCTLCSESLSFHVLNHDLPVYWKSSLHSCLTMGKNQEFFQQIP